MKSQIQNQFKTKKLVGVEADVLQYERNMEQKNVI